MPEPIPFTELIRRVRAGDEQASAELVRVYGPAIRVAVHVRLNDAGLRRLFDSVDICQSVLGIFFSRAASGQFELERPEQLVGLLVTMARNRLTSHALREQAACRDYRRTVRNPTDDLIDGGPSPSDMVSGDELEEAFRSRLSAEESWLAEQCVAGRGWTEIAAEFGGTPDALRMRLSRALGRITRELRLAE